MSSEDSKTSSGDLGSAEATKTQSGSQSTQNTSLTLANTGSKPQQSQVV